MDFKTFLKILAKLSGSLLLSTGIFLIVFAFVSSNIANNVDKIGDTVKEVSVPFIAENKEAIRLELSKAYANEQFIKKDQALVACKNPGQISEEYKDLISEDFCSKVNSMSDLDVRDYILGYLIDHSTDKLAESMSSEQALGPIKDTVSAYGGAAVKTSGLIIGSLLYLLGVLLISIGSNFHLVYGLYAVIIRTTLNLASIALVFLIVRLVSVDSVMAFIEWLRNVLAIGVQELPTILLKFVVTVALAWIRLSLNPVLIGVLIALAPCIGLSIFLYIKKKKLTDEVKKEELNKNEAEPKAEKKKAKKD